MRPGSVRVAGGHNARVRLHAPRARRAVGSLPSDVLAGIFKLVVTHDDGDDDARGHASLGQTIRLVCRAWCQLFDATCVEAVIIRVRIMDSPTPPASGSAAAPDLPWPTSGAAGGTQQQADAGPSSQQDQGRRPSEVDVDVHPSYASVSGSMLAVQPPFLQLQRFAALGVLRVHVVGHTSGGGAHDGAGSAPSFTHVNVLGIDAAEAWQQQQQQGGAAPGSGASALLGRVSAAMGSTAGGAWGRAPPPAHRGALTLERYLLSQVPHLQHLGELVLADLGLTRLPRAIHMLPRLKDLDLTRCRRRPFAEGRLRRALPGRRVRTCALALPATRGRAPSAGARGARDRGAVPACRLCWRPAQERAVGVGRAGAGAPGRVAHQPALLQLQPHAHARGARATREVPAARSHRARRATEMWAVGAARWRRHYHLAHTRTAVLCCPPHVQVVLGMSSLQQLVLSDNMLPFALSDLQPDSLPSLRCDADVQRRASSALCARCSACGLRRPARAPTCVFAGCCRWRASTWRSCQSASAASPRWRSSR